MAGSAQIFPVIAVSSVSISSPLPVPTTDAADGPNGSPVPSSTLQVGGSDGTDLRTLLTDTSGRQEVVGAAASGAAVAGNPVLAGGSDGTDARTILTDTAGRQEVVGAAASGAAVAGNPVLVSGSDGTDARTVLTDTSGRQEVVGAAASGAAAAGNPVLVSGSDGTDARTLLTDTTGQLKILDESFVAQGSTTSGETGPLVQMATVTSAPTDTNAETNPLRGDAAGCLRINPAGQTGSYKSVIGSNPVAGANFSISVTTGKKWVLRAFKAQLITAVAAATRQADFVIEDASSNVIVNLNVGSTQLASLTVAYVFGEGYPFQTAAVNNALLCPIPVLVLGPGFTITFQVTNIQAADQIQNIALLVEEYND